MAAVEQAGKWYEISGSKTRGAKKIERTPRRMISRVALAIESRLGFEIQAGLIVGGEESGA